MPSFGLGLCRLSQLTCCVLLSFGLVGCDKFKSAEDMVVEAKAAQQKGDNKTAILQLKNAVEKDPNNVETRYTLGMLYSQLGDAKSAEKELRRALELGMDKHKVFPELLKNLLADGQFQKILDDTKTLPPEEETPDVWATRGSAYLALDKQAQAKEAFERALKEQPDFSPALLGMARIAFAAKDKAETLRLLEQAITKNPNDSEPKLFKADMLRDSGQSEQALALYDEILKNKPTDEKVLVSKAGLLIGLNKFADAQVVLDAAKKVAPNNLMMLYTQALNYFRQGKHAQANDILLAILKVSPDNLPTMLLAATVQYSLGSYTLAEDQLKKYLNKRPNESYPRLLMATVVLRQGNTERAQELLAPLLEDESMQKNIQLLSTAGDLYMQQGDFAKASEFLSRASALNPALAQTRTALAMSKLAQGKTDQALQDLEAAIELEKDSVRTGVLAVSVYVKLKQYDKALAIVEKLEKKQPKDVLVYNVKGGVFLAKKDFAAARASFEKATTVDASNFFAVNNLVQLDMHDKKPDQAKKRLQAFLEKDKKNIQAMHTLAGIAMAENQPKEATTWFENAHKENPDALPPALALGAHYLRVGEKEKAFKLAEKLTGEHSAKPEVFELLAQANLANNQYQAAIDNYNRIIPLMPQSPIPYFRIAGVYMIQKDHGNAMSYLKKAMAERADFVEGQRAMVGVLASKGDIAGAQGIAQQMQKQYAKSSVGWLLEGDLLANQKKFDQAAVIFDKAFAIDKQSSSLIRYHLAAARAGKAAAADARLAQWLKEHGDDNAIRNYYAGSLIEAKQTKAAIEQYQIVLKQEPANSLTLNNLASLYLEEKDPRALEIAEKAYQISPKEPAVMDTLGWILVSQGNIKRGLPLIQEANRIMPEVQEIHYHLAMALMKSGDKAGAKTELNKLINSNKPFPQLEEAKAALKQL